MTVAGRFGRRAVAALDRVAHQLNVLASEGGRGMSGASALADAKDGHGGHHDSGSRASRESWPSAAEPNHPVFIGSFEAASMASGCGDD